MLLTTTGCVREVVSRPTNFIVRAMGGKRAKAKPIVAKHDSSYQSGDNFHEVFERQTRGAYNPQTDNRRVAQLQARLQVDPQDVPSRIELAGFYERYGVNDKAFEEYRLAIESLSKATKAMSKSSFNELESAAQGYGRTALATGQGSVAIPVLDQLSKHTPSIRVWDELGTLYDAALDYASGERSFRQSILLSPNSYIAHNNLGYNLILQKKTEAAEAEFRRAIALNAKFAAAHNNLATVLAQRNDFIGAFEQFRLGASDLAEAHNNFAVVLLEQGLYERGRDELIEALKARYYFAPSMENYKLVQELIKQRSELMGVGGSLALETVHLSPLIAKAYLPSLENAVKVSVADGNAQVQNHENSSEDNIEGLKSSSSAIGSATEDRQ